jgi:hypothetical protein
MLNALFDIIVRTAAKTQTLAMTGHYEGMLIFSHKVPRVNSEFSSPSQQRASQTNFICSGSETFL